VLLDSVVSISIEGTVLLNEIVVDDELTDLAIDVLAGSAVVNGDIELLPGEIIDLPVAVGVDIKPGVATGCINLRSRGVTPVAILGSPGLEVGTITQRR
jgi:hypothetical protein